MDFSEPTQRFHENSAPVVSARVVILNSRQGKMPCGQDSWIINTVKAAKFAANNGWTVITGIGMNTWEMAVWACSAAGTHQIIAIPEYSNADMEKIRNEILADFNMLSEKTGWLLYPAKLSRSAKTGWPKRDKLAIEAADILIPISIRPGGNLEKLMANYPTKRIINDFKIDYLEQSSERIIPPEPDSVSQQLTETDWDHICHWTHTNNGPWPGQNRADYYRSIAESETYPNNGLNSLINILQTHRIYASSENIRVNQKAVAFSNLHPKEMLSLMSWRKRYVRYNFEPYGIAITRHAAVTSGMRPVIYGPPSLYKRLADSDKPFFQSEGAKGGDWRPENEWRYVGDLDLSQFSISDLLVVVRDKLEIEAIKKQGDWRVISYC